MTIPSLTQRFIVPDLPSADDLIPYLRQIDANRWYSNFGPLAQSFEQRFIQRMAQVHGDDPGTFIATGLASGYQALTVGLRLLGVGPEDKVLVPSVTFPACPLAVSNLGATPVLSDVDPKTFSLTPAIARAAAAKTKLAAVMPVAVYGFPLPAEEWDAFEADTGVKVIIDAAAAIESQRYLKRGLVAHSMHALKPFGIGEGGVLVTADPAMAETIRQRINFGMSNRITYQTGENAKMSEYHAAVALAQLDRWDQIKQRRADVFTRFAKALEGLITLNPLHQKAIVSSLMIETKAPAAKALFAAMTQHQIAVHRTYLPPLYEHPHFAALPALKADGQSAPQGSQPHLDGAEYMNEHVLGLPFHAFMSDEEIHHTVTILKDCMSH